MLKEFNFEKTPVVEIVNEIMVDSARRGASDIHFDPHDNFLQVRIRIDGELMNYTKIPNEIAKNLVTRIKIISGMNITESRLPQDGAIKTNLEDLNLDLRVSALPTNKGEKIVIRILDYSLSLAGLESLGFSDENYKKVLKMIETPNGIILVTGATGSGKSTTVYSILQRLNKENTNIISVEDPIEMDIEGINQIQANSEIGLDFATVLRSILRQDPNIIMIGEIRDTETAKIAVRASITGHLVLSTIHTNDSLNTIERLLDMDVERYLLASALTGIISQKLARRLCPHCKKLRPTNDYEKDIIKKVTGQVVNDVYTAVGCDKCKNGYSGRIAIHEVLMIDQNIKDAISSNIRKDKLRHLVYNSDVISLLKDGMTKVLDGLTTLEELLKIIELDDDETLHSTGLDNAIKVDEMTKEDNNTNEMTPKGTITDNNVTQQIVNKDNSSVYDTNINDNNKTNNNPLDFMNMPSTNNEVQNRTQQEEKTDKTMLNNINNIIKEENTNNIVQEKTSIENNQKEIKPKHSLFGSKRNIFK